MTNLVQLPSRHLLMTSSSNPFNRPLPSFRNSSTLQFYSHRTPYPVHHQITAPTIKCMANPRRVKMVAKQIRRELSDMLLTDKNLQYAVLPEAALGADRYLSSLATISDVEVSADLQVQCLFCVREAFFVAEVFDALSAGYNRVLSSIYARVVKVYVSVFGDQRGREVAISGLKSKSKYVRSQLGKRMKLRLTPEVRFIEDESLERGSRVIAILDKIKNENEMKVGESDGKKEAASELHSDGEDWEEEGVDEDIIYVD